MIPSLAPALLLAANPVRAEPVEAPPLIREKGDLSASSGRKEGGSATDAERAFAADAQRLGQWTAFAKWAATDATMFTPQPVKAKDWLKGRADPAKAIEWWPIKSFVSCDGSLVANHGGWQGPGGSVGYFTTVWARQANGSWRWVINHGDVTPKARSAPRHVVIERASCARLVNLDNLVVFSNGSKQGDVVSTDGTLKILWIVEANGSRSIRVTQAGVVSWRGRRRTILRDVLIDAVPASPKP